MALPLLALLLATARAPPAAAQQVFNVLEYGAKGDGATSDTAAIRAATAALQAAGGGTLLFPARRRYLTGAFNLSSHTVLRLEANAVIHGSGNSSEYPLLTLFGEHHLLLADDFGLLLAGLRPHIDGAVLQRSGPGSARRASCRAAAGRPRGSCTSRSCSPGGSAISRSWRTRAARWTATAGPGGPS